MSSRVGGVGGLNGDLGAFGSDLGCLRWGLAKGVGGGDKGLAAVERGRNGIWGDGFWRFAFVVRGREAEGYRGLGGPDGGDGRGGPMGDGVGVLRERGRGGNGVGVLRLRVIISLSHSASIPPGDVLGVSLGLPGFVAPGCVFDPTCLGGGVVGPNSRGGGLGFRVVVVRVVTRLLPEGGSDGGWTVATVLLGGEVCVPPLFPVLGE
eukprot:42586-Eustigmatos_ZCMA.PRE.1